VIGVEVPSPISHDDRWLAVEIGDDR